MRLLPACALSLLLGVLPVQAAGPVASALPAVPLVETLRDARHLNFDLIFSNDSGPALELIGLEAMLFDREGRRLDLAYEINLWDATGNDDLPSSVIAPVNPRELGIDPLTFM